jgi:hypothetical protein
VTADHIRKKSFLSWRLRLQTTGIYRVDAIPGYQIRTGGSAYAATRPGLAPKSALRLHPCRALSSAPVSNSVVDKGNQTKHVVVVDREK